MVSLTVAGNQLRTQYDQQQTDVLEREKKLKRLQAEHRCVRI